MGIHSLILSELGCTMGAAQFIMIGLICLSIANFGQGQFGDESCKTREDCYGDNMMCALIQDAGCICKDGMCKISSGCGTNGAFFFTPCTAPHCDQEDCEDEGVCHWVDGGQGCTEIKKFY